ncbi:MAG: glycine--tRNA ligase subunit beta [Synechococcales cyanobacterium]
MDKNTFLLEVGTEEMPATFVAGALHQWRSQISASLSEHFLTAESIEVYGTPRRLVVLVHGLPAQQPDRHEEIKGPSLQAAFANGQPGKAAIGFAQKQGLGVEQLVTRLTDKGEFLFALKRTPGQPTSQLLSHLAYEWIMGLEGKRLMRWGDGDLKFSRPIRWLLALWQEQLLPITITNGTETMVSGLYSQGHRVLHPQPVEITHSSRYQSQLQSAFIQVNPLHRRHSIQEQVQAIARTVGGHAVMYPELLDEVTHLVEWPTAIIGAYDPEFLNLPPEVITTVMVTHQRYFPVLQGELGGELSAPIHGAPLLPYFITISNGDPAKSSLIAAGNERVIRARLADAQFFYQADTTHSLEEFLPKLEQVTFQDTLGSMGQKVGRIQEIAGCITRQLNLNAQQQQTILRTSLLCKADLVTQMVGEFPELQGVIGQNYALVSGESEEIAYGIFEHYLPRNADDFLPQSLPGQVVGISDRLDTLVNIFGIGLLPSGSSDPFALRRAANAIITIIWSARLPLNLFTLLENTCIQFVTKGERQNPLPVLRDFFIQRVRNLLQDERSIDYDLVQAVLGDNDPTYTQLVLQDLVNGLDRALFLQTIRHNGTLGQIYPTVNRASRLAIHGDLPKEVLNPASIINPHLFLEPSEQGLYDALLQLLPITQSCQMDRDYQKLVAGLVAITQPVSDFFDGPHSVLVMDENPDIRHNRLNLLAILRNHALILADFNCIVKDS